MAKNKDAAPKEDVLDIPFVCTCKEKCDETKVAGATDDGKTYCPRTFVREVAPRFAPGTFAAGVCSQCGLVQLASVGHQACIGCRAHGAFMRDA